MQNTIDWSDEKTLDHYEYYTNSKELTHLAEINFLIGPNNSGKSAFMRSLFASRKLLHKNELIYKYNSILPELFDLLKQKKTEIHFQLVSKYSSIPDQLKPIEHVSINPGNIHRCITVHQEIEKINASYFLKIYPNGMQWVLESDIQKIHELSGYSRKILDQLISICKELDSQTRIYIPVLRGIKTLNDNFDPNATKDLLYLRTYNDYFKAEELEFKHTNELANFAIFTGQSLYSETQKMLLGDLEMRDWITSFQNLLSERFFQNKKIALIPKLANSQINLKIGDEKERSISQLGDGLQTVIIIAFAIFQNLNKDAIIYIEEPENNLHPGLQRQIFELLKFGAENGIQFFITTHSNHFLDLTFDYNNISIYTFRKEFHDVDKAKKERTAKIYIENIQSADTRILGFLEVRNSSVFLTNATIWVEGVTDRLYIKKFLELYETSLKIENENYSCFKLDIHFTICEYAGANITHWNFTSEDADEKILVDRLCSKTFVVADNDLIGDSKSEKAERIRKLKESLEDRFYVLKVKEIENLISPEILYEVVADYEKETSQKLKPLLNLDFEEYKMVNLGDYLDTSLGNKKKRKGSYKDGNTISDKSGFAKRSIQFYNDFSQLSNDAQELTKKIYSFIKDQNK